MSPVHKKPIRIDCHTWHPKMDVKEFFVYMPYMFKYFNLISHPKPDFVITSGRRIPGNHTSILYTPENKRPRMDCFDWAFTFDYDEELKHPRHMRLPNYTRLGAGVNLIKRDKKINALRILKSKRKFCAFVYKHSVAKRNRFFGKLSQYKRVDAPSKCAHNMMHLDDYLIKHKLPFNKRRPYDRKVEFLKAYKFTIAFEHTSYPGYTTEKIYHAMLANSIPIYFGNPLIHRDFNTKSFVNVHDYKTFAAAIERVKEIDRNDDLYLEYLEQPWYPKNKVTPYVDEQRIVKRFEQIFLG